MARIANPLRHIVKAALPGGRTNYWRYSGGTPLASQYNTLRLYYLNTYGLDPKLVLVKQVAEETRHGGRSLRIEGNIGSL